MTPADGLSVSGAAAGAEDVVDEGESGRARPKKAPTAFRTISEVADELHIPQHVLRFWETKFPQVKPLKRGGGRRYYRPDDIALLRRISDLLYIQGYTIKGVPPGSYTVETIAYDSLANKASVHTTRVDVASPDETKPRLSSIAVLKRAEPLTARP